MTPKQMHLVSDPTSFNTRTTFPVRRSAHGLRGSGHYSRHSRSSRHPLVTLQTQRSGQCQLGTPHRVPPDPGRSVRVVPASKRAQVTSLDASVRTERVMFCHPSPHWRTAELRACVRACTRSWSQQTEGLPRHFSFIIKGF